MENLKTSPSVWRIPLLLAILITLSPLNIIFNNVNTPSLLVFHSFLEVIATFLALFISILTLVRYYSKKDDTILFIGFGFLGTSLLEAFHGIVSHSSLTAASPEDISFQFPWSWLASRYFLSFFLLFSFLAWRFKGKVFQSESTKEIYYLTLSIFLTVLTFLFFNYAPIMPELYSLSGLPRPLEIIPALFFAIALIGYLYKGHWKTNIFEYCIVVSLLINFICQAFYMPFSDEIFDLTANMAHYLKITSYVIVIVGLLIELNQNYQQAAAANRTKTDFLNIMSHELRTPLTIILGYTPLLKKPEKMPEVKKLIKSLDNKDLDANAFSNQLELSLNEVSKYTRKMDVAGKNLLSLINDMLDLSKIEAGMMKATGEAINIDQKISEICEPFQIAATQKGLSINIRTSDHTIYADENKFSKIMSILIDNAIQNSDSGLIDISSKQLKNMIEIAVADTGRGIDPKALNHMTDRFSNANIDTKTYIGGMGLSLALCQALVELHGGTIAVISELNQGITFTITLPVSQE